MSDQPTTPLVPFTPDQLILATRALRDEVKKRTRSIDKAEEQRRAGVRVQENVLQSHYEAREQARAILANLEEARRQYAQRIADQLEQGRRPR